MDPNEGEVTRHYGLGGLEVRILDGLRRMGRDPDDVRPEDLAGVDEFHIGGNAATEELADQIGLHPGMSVLDIGCGIGGPARFLANRYGCMVTGIDLTPEFVDVATSLTRMLGMSERVNFHVGSALRMPFAPSAFEAATMLHVGMNIADKPALFAEIHRVLVGNGVFGLYDIMRTGPGDIAFPLPWASSGDTSFVATPEDYRRALADAGFEVEAERQRGEYAVEFFRRMKARIAAEGPPALGFDLAMGPQAPAKVANLVAAVGSGIVAPVELICRRG